MQLKQSSILFEDVVFTKTGVNRRNSLFLSSDSDSPWFFNPGVLLPALFARPGVELWPFEKEYPLFEIKNRPLWGGFWDGFGGVRGMFGECFKGMLGGYLGVFGGNFGSILESFQEVKENYRKQTHEIWLCLLYVICLYVCRVRTCQSDAAMIKTSV